MTSGAGIPVFHPFSRFCRMVIKKEMLMCFPVFYLKNAENGLFDQKLCEYPSHCIMIMHYTIILDAQADGGYTARCVELSEALGQGSTQGEALASIRESIERVQAARGEVLHKTMSAVNSEIIRIEVADTA